MIDPLLENPKWVFWALGALGSAALFVIHMKREQNRIVTRLEGDDKDETNDGFLVETEKSLDHIEDRLDDHNERFDSIDESLRGIERTQAQIIKSLDNGNAPDNYPVGRWDGGFRSQDDAENDD